jgi:DNA repair protein RecO (recombination protein O)
MYTERAEAIVLRTQSVTESSLIVTWFTREFGKLKTLAKGARRAKSPFRGKLDLFYRDEIVFLRSRRSDLHLLHDCFLENPHAKLRDTVESLAAASYVGELVESATAMEDTNPKMFDLLSAALDALETPRGRASVLIWFELQLLAVAGWAPKWEVRSPVSKLLDSLAGTSVEGARRVRLKGEQVQDARTALWLFWDEHIGKTPRSRKLLIETLPQ